MEKREFSSIIGAILILTLVFGFYQALRGDYNSLIKYLIFSTIIISTAIIAKKWAAYSLDAKVDHEIWHINRIMMVSRQSVIGFTEKEKFKKPFPTGIFVPLIITILSAGLIKFAPILTFQAEATKYRAAKRFGSNSTLFLSEQHISLIAASGALGLFTLSIINYLLFPQYSELSKLSIYYAISNLLPISDLDGSQMYFGSRLIAKTIWIISAIFFFVAFWV